MFKSKKLKKKLKRAREWGEKNIDIHREFSYTLENFPIEVHSLKTFLNYKYNGLDENNALRALLTDISDKKFCKGGKNMKGVSWNVINENFLEKKMKNSLYDKNSSTLCFNFTEPDELPRLIGFCVLSNGCGYDISKKDWETIQIFCVDPDFRPEREGIKITDLFLDFVKNFTRNLGKNKIAIDIAGGWWDNKPSYNFFKRNGAKPWDPKFGKCFDSSPTWRGVGPLLSNYNPLYTDYSMYIDLE